MNNLKKNYTDHPVLFKLVTLCAGLILGFISVKIIFLLMIVKTESMSPSLKPGDKILINKLASIKKGDIIALKSPIEGDKILLSRIIASESETIEIKKKVIYINDHEFNPAWIVKNDNENIFPMKFCSRDYMTPLKLAKNEYFIIGDNFDSSFDSRNFGKITSDMIIGKIVYKR